MYDKPNKETFINKIEKAQYDAVLAITGAIRATSRKKLYAELGIELPNLGNGSANWLDFVKFSHQYYLSIYFN